MKILFVLDRKNNNMNKYFIENIAFLLCLWLVACTSKPTTTEDAPKDTPQDGVVLTAQQIKNIGVATALPIQRSVSNEISTNGMIDVPPQQAITISVPITGNIQKMSLLEGMSVHKGQVLATIQSMEFVQMQQDYLQAQSRLHFLEKELERDKDLSQNNAVTIRQYQQTEADYRVTKATTKALEAKFQLLNISLAILQKGNISAAMPVITPVNGFVKAVYVNNGKYITPSEKIFDLLSNEHLHLNLKVFEKDIAAVKLGQKVKVVSPIVGSRPIFATILMVGKAIDEQNKTLQVHAHFDNENTEHQFVYGQYISGRILADGKQALTLPEESILTEGNQKFVYIQANVATDKTTFKKVVIQTGISQGGYVEVLSPVSISQQQVVSKGVFRLHANTAQAEEE
jgi:membrane fusion protein, heavy metal efflux system